jgi:hypothetical protein
MGDNTFKTNILLCCCDKNPERDNLKGQNIYFIHGFRGFCPQSIDFIDFRPVVSRKASQRKAAYLMLPRMGDRERKRERDRDRETRDKISSSKAYSL